MPQFSNTYKAFGDREIDRAVDLLAPNGVAYLVGLPAPPQYWI